MAEILQRLSYKVLSTTSANFFALDYLFIHQQLVARLQGDMRFIYKYPVTITKFQRQILKFSIAKIVQKSNT